MSDNKEGALKTQKLDLKNLSNLKVDKKDKVLATKNLKSTKVKVPKKEEVISHRYLKWKYPDELTDTLDRKSYRQKNRDKIRKLERDILKAEGKELTKFEKELAALRKEVLTDVLAEV